MTLADVLTLAACVALLVPATAAAIRAANGDGGRVKCASNLRQIGYAIQTYANEQRNGAFPRTIAVADAPPTTFTGADASNPFLDGGPTPNDVTAALFLLLRTQDIVPEVFTCPYAWHKRWDYGGGTLTAQNHSNWPDGRYLSYSYANPYASPAAIDRGFKFNSSLTAEFALMADLNPGVPELLTTPRTADARVMRRVNSPNHEFDGQNVLYADGHSEFQANPFVGVQRDNIYTANAGPMPSASPLAATVAGPFDGNDSVMLPVWDGTGRTFVDRPGAAMWWWAGLGLLLIVGLIATAWRVLARSAEPQST